MHCIHCGTENPEGLKFCNQCGPPLKSMGRCAKCGVDNAPGARFCEECGGGLSAAIQATSLDIDRSGLPPDSQARPYFAPGNASVFARPSNPGSFCYPPAAWWRRTWVISMWRGIPIYV
jgi:hypothetical protein